MKLLVTGGGGAFAMALRAEFPEAIYLSRHELDVRDAEQCERVILHHRPTHVLHAAAITDHQCPDMGALINTNVIGTANVMMGAEQVEADLIYLSTHYVYPGDLGGFTERAPVAPIGTYAWTKYAGERIVDTYNHNTLIVRGSWYTEQKLRLWERGAIVDAVSSRESVRSAAAKVAWLIRLKACGTYNIGGPTRTFCDIMRDEERPVVPITRDSLKLPYPFPPNTTVDTRKYRRIVGQ